MSRVLIALGTIGLASFFTYNTVFSSPSIELPNGTWVFDGYGHVIEANDKQLKLFDATEHTCVRVDVSSNDIATMLQDFTIKLDSTGKTAAFYELDDTHPKIAHSADSLPQSCVPPTANTVEGNFNAFADFIQTHHGFLKVHGIDWPERIAAAKPKLSEQMDDKALFALFSEMLEGLNDPHTSLLAEINGEETIFQPQISPTKRGLQAALDKAKIDTSLLRYFWFEHLAENVLNGQGKMTQSKRFQYGVLGQETGYIAILEMQNFAGKDESDYTKSMAGLHASMEEILSYFKENNVEQIIVDVSLNPGGDDAFSRAIAGYFTEQTMFAYSKKALDAKDPVTTKFEITPAQSKLHFTGPVTLITSGTTYSAAEIFTMSMRGLPNVTHIGEPTSGGLSDILSKQLPNGWVLNLSNEQYLDKDGISWEGLGIKPERAETVFLSDSPFQSHQALVQSLIK